MDLVDSEKMPEVREKSSLESYLSYTGTAGAFLTAVPAIGYAGKLAENVFGAKSYANFLTRHAISGFSGAVVFALLETTFKYMIEYQKASEKCSAENPLTVGEYLSTHKGEIAATFASLLIAGGFSFGLLTGVREYFTRDQGIKLNSLIADMIAFSASMGAFAGCNFASTGLSSNDFNIQMPWEKFSDLFGIFLAYIVGIHLTDVLSSQVNEFANTWVKPLVAPMLGAAGGLLGNVAYKIYSQLPACSIFSSCGANHQFHLISQSINKDRIDDRGSMRLTSGFMSD